MRRGTFYVAIPLAVAALACDKEPIDPVTGGEGSGSEGFRVVVTDDPGLDVDPALEGTLAGTIRISLRNDAGALVALGSDGVEIPLHVGADTIALEGLGRPPIDDYTAVQVRFEGTDVDVLAGSEVGDSTLTQDFTLELGSAGAAVVDVLVPVFGVDAATTTEIVIDLNSEDWVTGENLEASAVPTTDLANAVTVDVQ